MERMGESEYLHVLKNRVMIFPLEFKRRSAVFSFDGYGTSKYV